MKKGISILLALLMLISNIGFAMNTYFCGGEAVETTYTLGLGNPDCGMAKIEKPCQDMSSDHERFKSKPCCENKHQVIETDEMAKTQPSSSSVNPVFLAAVIQVFLLPVFFIDKGQTQLSDYSPPLPEKDVQVLFQTFLI